MFRPKGEAAVSDDWLEEEENSIRAEETDAARRADRAREVSRRASYFWHELLADVKEAVQKINKSEAIQKRVKCELKFFEDSVSSFKVDKEVFPAIRMRVSLSGTTIRVERAIARVRYPDKYPYENDSVSRTEEKEELNLFLDTDDQLLLQNEKHQLISPEQLPKYLLRPLLVEATQIRGPRIW